MIVSPGIADFKSAINALIFRGMLNSTILILQLGWAVKGVLHAVQEYSRALASGVLHEFTKLPQAGAWHGIAASVPLDYNGGDVLREVSCSFCGREYGGALSVLWPRRGWGC